MKYANPIEVDTIETSLATRPIDIDAIMETANDSNYKYVLSVVLGTYAQTAKNFDILKKNQEQTNAQLRELIESAKDTRVTETKLAKFFVTAPYLVDKFSYDAENKQLLYKNSPIKDGDDCIAFLSIDLQNYFSGHIPYGVLLTGIKRYFAILRRQDNILVNFIEEYLEDYFSTYTTKKRSRVFLKDIKKACEGYPDSTQKLLKSIMEDLGYTEHKDTSRAIYYTKP
jgi:hypothetical protein